MRAVGYSQSLPITDERALLDIEVEMPQPAANDLLVRVKAVSVNPIDVKTRLGESASHNQARILGYDASGVVEAVGERVREFRVGDHVYYAGTINRQGSNSDFQVVDHRLVAKKPQSLDFATAASMPLTSLTAYEMLVDRLNIKTPVHSGRNALLINAGAGGVGSVAIQLAKQLKDIVVIATASREQSRQWCIDLGADFVIDHRQPFAQQLIDLNMDKVAFIFSNAQSDYYLPQYAEIIAPQGRIGVIDSPRILDVNPLKKKSVSVHWESMFTRSLYETDDISRQGLILREVATMIDDGLIKPTLKCILHPMNAATLRHAHALIESQRTIGKIVVENSPS